MSSKCPALEALPLALAAMAVLCCDGDFRALATGIVPTQSCPIYYSSHVLASSVIDGLHLLTFASKHKPDILAEAARQYPIINDAVTRFVEDQDASNTES